jgi:DNA polymerase type B, organellar and viral
MYIITSENMVRSEADRHRAYRQANPERYRKRDASRKRASRAKTLPEFVGVDGEGVGKGIHHRYVLLGVGNAQFENPMGIKWHEALEFLYAQFQKRPRASFVGFYLRYDFDNILSYKAGFPIEAARMLFTKEGKAVRKKPDKRNQRMQSFPVRVGGWEIDMLGMKRLSIRPRPDGCECYEHKSKCTHKQLPWMHICDAGPFYQMGFVKVIDPDRWKDDPDGPVCSAAQFKRIKEGKDKRAYATRIDDKMRAYNVEENVLLSVVMTRLAKGFHSVDIKPAKDQWYGPGATASQWLAKHGTVKRQQLQIKDGKKPPLMPKWFWGAASASYFGGWFEIFSHGIIGGTSYNYDINNAYPYAATKLPHICRDGRFVRDSGTYSGRGQYVLLYCTVYSKGTRIGAMPHRNKQGNILRPLVTKGWYWRFELESARAAGLVKRVVTHEWVEFIPCDHEAPFKEIHDLYYLRLKVGKDSAQGMAIKLNNNSIYGKFAQSVGGAPYNNWLYASYITAHCRAQILDAIATHPDKASAVLMVATDGICFDSPHPSLAISKQLGEWAHTEYKQLCLYKPGVYWHKEGKDNLLKAKTRGVPKEEFIKQIDKVEKQFQAFLDEKAFPGWDFKEYLEASIEKHIGPQSDCDDNAHKQDLIDYDNERWWPRFVINVSFRMKSCTQALNEGHWEKSAQIDEKFPVWQDSNPCNKRDIQYPHSYEQPKNFMKLSAKELSKAWDAIPTYGMSWNVKKERIDSSLKVLDIKDIHTYYHNDVVRPPHLDLGTGLDGDATGPMIEGFTMLRDKPANYDLPITETGIQWERVWG